MPFGQHEVVPRRRRFDPLRQAFEPDARPLAAQAAQVGSSLGVPRGSGGELPRAGVDRRRAQPEVLRDLLDGLGERARNRLAERGVHRAPSLGRRGELHDAVQRRRGRSCVRPTRRRAPRPVRRARRAAPRRSRRGAFAASTTGSPSHSRTSRSTRRASVASSGPAGGRALPRTTSATRPSAAAKACATPELRIAVVAVEPDGDARAGARGRARQLRRRAAVARRETRAAGALRSTPSRRSSGASMPVRW